MKQSKRKRRFHREVFFPSWSNNSMDIFIDKIHGSGALKFSLHSISKLMELKEIYGRLLWEEFSKLIRGGALDRDKIFEFYTSKEEEITKACFRYRVKNLPVDLILVISVDGVIITVYHTNREDSHRTMSPKLYEKRDE